MSGDCRKGRGEKRERKKIGGGGLWEYKDGLDGGARIIKQAIKWDLG